MVLATPNITPAGTASQAARKLCELVAESSTFQARVGVATQAAAYAFVHFPFIRRKTEVLDAIPKPAAIVSLRRYTRRRKAARSLSAPAEIGLELILLDEDRYPGDPEGSATDFMNFCDGVEEDLLALEGQDTRLPIQSIDLVVPYETDPQKRAGQAESYWSAAFQINWGF